MIVVSHDLGVIKHFKNKFMYCDEKWADYKQGLSDQIFQDPQHAYTQLFSLKHFVNDIKVKNLNKTFFIAHGRAG